MVNLYIELARQKPQVLIFTMVARVFNQLSRMSLRRYNNFLAYHKYLLGTKYTTPMGTKDVASRHFSGGNSIEWEARCSLQEGLATTFAWFKANRGL